MAIKAETETSIAKAREAQKKFEESKKKVEAAKKKAEEASKKVQELRQRIKETQSKFKILGGIKGGIAGIAAFQIGSLRGKLVAQVQLQVLSMLNKFSSGCPNSKELEKLIKTRNTLIKHLTSFEKRVQKFADIARKLTATIAAIRLLIKVITSIPVPTAIIPPQIGGIGIPVSVLTKYSNTLIKLDKILDRLLGEAAAITGLTLSIAPSLTNLKNRLDSIDLAIQQCSVGQPADLNQILATAQPKENTGSEGTPTDAQGNPDPDYLYKGYVLAIIQDLNSPKVAPRRYAIASDRGGTVRLRGQSSFSSDTRVLLDEIKFRIDQLL